ncbi:MAG: hypothetical protein GYB65_12555, partial [Chloroflexi bacterium]|nr:hypothetical protein [Chloroflexota bacterium]
MPQNASSWWPKLTAITWKDLYQTFQDRNALLYMFAMPVALSLIIGLAFGTGGDISIDEIPLAIVNGDEGHAQDTDDVASNDGGDMMRLGDIYETAFVPSGDA